MKVSFSKNKYVIDGPLKNFNEGVGLIKIKIARCFNQNLSSRNKVKMKTKRIWWKPANLLLCSNKKQNNQEYKDALTWTRR